MTVSLLIIYHAAMAHNTWGEANYICLGESGPASFIVVFISPWFMPLMFLLAGMSSRFSIRRRGYGVFLRERALRLELPLILGILIINPILSYIADVTHNGYEGGFLAHYSIFFTRFTDLSGYDGGFCLAHLWFILVLIIISFLSCGVFRVVDMIPPSRRTALLPAGGVLLFIAAVAGYDIKLLGKPILLYLSVYLAGYYVFTDDSVMERIAKIKWILVPHFVVASAADALLFVYVPEYEVLNTVMSCLSFALGVPALMGIGHDLLDRTGSLMKFCSCISYTFYIIHFPVVVLCQFFLMRTGAGSVLNLVLTVLISYPVTVLLCLFIDKIKCMSCRVSQENSL